MCIGRHGGGWQVFGDNMNLLAEKTGYFPDEKHHRNFIESIRTRKAPNATIEQGVLSASMINLANLSYRAGKSLIRIDGESGAIVDNDEAASLDQRIYRQNYNF